MAKTTTPSNPEGLLVDPVKINKSLKQTLASWKKDPEISKELLKNFELFVKNANDFEKARFFAEKGYHLPPMSAYTGFTGSLKPPVMFVRVCCKVRVDTYDPDGNPAVILTEVCTSYPLQEFNPILHSGKNCTIRKF